MYSQAVEPWLTAMIRQGLHCLTALVGRSLTSLAGFVWITALFSPRSQVAKSKKDGDYSEDLAADLEKSVQTLTDDNIKRLDKTAAAKSDELKKI